MGNTLKIDGKLFVAKVSGATMRDANYHAGAYHRDHYVRIIKRKIRSKIEREMMGLDTVYIVYVSKRKRN